MSNNIVGPVILVGAGIMAQDYAKVLCSLGRPFKVVGRGDASAQSFEKNTGVNVIRGGLKKYLDSSTTATSTTAIIAVGVSELCSTAQELIAKGFKNLLIEKPAGMNADEVRGLNSICRNQGVTAYVAYNRRFYSSVLLAQRLIAEDGGVLSYSFEFTEWGHTIEPLTDEDLKRNWFFANSSHVVDLAFYLGSLPRTFSSYVSGSLSWHPQGSIFSGAGVAKNGALFSYCANWEAPGRWGVEVLTKKRRFILRPLEKLQIQNIGSVAIVEHPLEGTYDTDFKPGLYLETMAFLETTPLSAQLLSLADHVKRLPVYEQILAGGYSTL